jgi:RNase H-fold protein (predicted Holliday junction resolvase)
MKVLTTPSKVASTLDWRKASGGAILTLTVHRDRIDMAVAQHPSSTSSLSSTKSTTTTRQSSFSSLSSSSSTPPLPFVQTLEPLLLEQKGRKIPDQSIQRLSTIVREQRICAFVVAWPVQPDNGKMGYSCGRTIWMMEELFKVGIKSTTTTTSSIISTNRPVCLWDSQRTTTQSGSTDMWGRNPDFALATTTPTTTDVDATGASASSDRNNNAHKSLHVASKEQYYVADETIVVSQVWDDFMKMNWPGIEYSKMNNTNSSSNNSSSSNQQSMNVQERQRYDYHNNNDKDEHLLPTLMVA